MAGHKFGSKFGIVKVQQSYNETFNVPGNLGISLKYQQDDDEDVRIWQAYLLLHLARRVWHGRSQNPHKV